MSAGLGSRRGRSAATGLVDQARAEAGEHPLSLVVAEGAPGELRLRRGAVAQPLIGAPERALLTPCQPRASPLTTNAHHQEDGPMQLSLRRRCSCRWADDWQDALARANDTRFGLQAVVFTRDLGWAMAAFERLDVGGVMVNDVPTFRVDSMPYGGAKTAAPGGKASRTPCGARRRAVARAQGGACLRRAVRPVPTAAESPMSTRRPKPRAFLAPRLAGSGWRSQSKILPPTVVFGSTGRGLLIAAAPPHL